MSGNGKARLMVTCALIRREGRVLVARRADNGLWELPGGKILPGESLEACLAREIAEELGARVEVGPFLGKVEMERERDILCLSAFGCRLAGGEPRALEHREIRWIDPGEFSGLDLCPADRELWPRLGLDSAGDPAAAGGQRP